MTADSFSLVNKVAIVTGSARENGIGAAIARALARNGASVTINYVSESSAGRAAKVAESIKTAGGKAVVVGADVSKIEGAEKLVKETLEAFEVDHIDILVNNAGVGGLNSTLDIPVETLTKLFEVNVFAPLFTVRSVIPHMPQGGRIINVSSVASKMGVSYMPAYGASKAALDSLTNAWAEEFGKSHGITVNTIAPGPVVTDMAGEDGIPEEIVKAFLAQTRAANRLGTVEDIADGVLFLTLEKSRWITGQYISLSGGMTIS